ncbi:MAG TPA: deoxyguanosinetriphosphate triphosphohydrolase [Pseudonocardiaceae bacterium]|nr:deoxyguanosinetriphosphate triphosphohydrolase [Pseudonocardiaceae bacterium]
MADRPGGYTEHDWARLLPEPPKQAALPGSGPERRSPFSRDRARVLHSAALRRLAGKTQVVGPGEGDVPRTRLTHSLEVAQIGHSIAAELGCDPDLVETAGLAHDIGHPPFGHNGERALNEVAAGCGGFEANAQTLRILTRLEPKLIDPVTGRSHGLNLTRAALDATVKYPWPRRDGTVKFGCYTDDAPVFAWLRADAPDAVRCLEAQVMDWADDVAYSVHDVEDGILAGRISLGTLADPAERAVLAELAAAHFSPLPVAELEAAATGLLAIPVLAALRSFDGSLSAQVGLKQLTSELVGRFAGAVVSATLARHGPSPLLRYRADLVIPGQVAAEVALLKAMALRFVMLDPDRLAAQARQRDLVTELCTAVRHRAPDPLDPALRPAWQQAGSDAARLRVVIDQVAALTDAQAVRWLGSLRDETGDHRARTFQ